MSNALAIATVTQALALLVANNLAPEIDMAVAVETRKPPAEPPTEPTITIFLYQVTPNASVRNSDLPTRASDGTLVKRAAAPLDLHYLISAYGEESELIGQRLIGCVVRTLHEIPVLPHDLIVAAAERPHLSGSDLADAVQRVRFTPTQMDVDETSKLWGMLHQTPYTLSVAYQASLVLLDGREKPVPAPPVERRTVRVAPFGAPGAPERPELPEGGPSPAQQEPAGAESTDSAATGGDSTSPGAAGSKTPPGSTGSAAGAAGTAAGPRSDANSAASGRRTTARASRTASAATAARGRAGESADAPAARRGRTGAGTPDRSGGSGSGSAAKGAGPSGGAESDRKDGAASSGSGASDEAAKPAASTTPATPAKKSGGKSGAAKAAARHGRTANPGGRDTSRRTSGGNSSVSGGSDASGPSDSAQGSGSTGSTGEKRA